MQLELDIAELSVSMGVPLAGLTIYRNDWTAAIQAVPQVNRWGGRRWHPTIHLGDGLLTSLTSAELKAVVAHELSHLKRGDCVRSVREMIVAIMPRPISYVHAWFKRRAEMQCDDYATNFVSAYDLACALRKMRTMPPVVDGGGLLCHHPSFDTRLKALDSKTIEQAKIQ